MTPERWKQIDQLLQEALEREPPDRAAFLAEACDGDDELRREVESLLGFHARAESFIEAPPTEMAADWLNAKESRAGQTIGHYRLIRQIGRGGMGEVYLAHDARLGRQIALKLLQSHLTPDAARVRRFRQEARAASSLNHPNILTIYEVGQDDLTAGGAHFIVAEFVDGRTLCALRRDGGLTLGAALDILIQVASALSAAHEAGIIHRDIKPENIMLRRDGLVKVLDFGLAKLTEQATRPHIGSFARVTTQPGMVMGTTSYMSPEQARGLEVDERSDLFSLGVVMYELMTGQAPFQGETTSDVLVALLSGEPRPLARYVARLPDALQRIVNRALAKQVERRYQSARELGDELKRLKEELEFAAKLKGQAGNKDDILTLTVGAPVDAAEHSTFDTLLAPKPDSATAPGRARFAVLRGWLRQRGRTLALAALVALIGGAVLAWRWLAPHGSAIDSVAVLPFANVGDDHQMAYLADGLTESLIDSLLPLPALRVTASSTVAVYKGRVIDPRLAGKELQVRAVVTGSVAWQGERMIIRVELVDTADGSRVWSDEFQRTHSQIVTAPVEIAREIAAKLHRRLSPASERQLARRHSADSKAYELYQRGRDSYRTYDPDSLNTALGYFQKAIERDPSYALAHCGVAHIYADLSGQYRPPSEVMPNARYAALKAIELDDTLPEAHFSLALVKLWGDWDWSAAEREYKRALELNPKFADARIYYAEFLADQKRFDEALREIKLAEENDPASLDAMGKEGDVYSRMRQYDRAIEIYRKALGLDPDRPRVQRGLGIALSQQGRHQEAIEQLSQLQTTIILVARAYVYARARRRGEALELLRALMARRGTERIPQISIARIYAGLGDKEQALVWLRKGYDEHSDHLLHIGADPMLDLLRSDPRFDKLLRDIGLTR